MRGDWVYRDNIFDEAGSPVDALGTYTPNLSSLTAGIDNAHGKILYDSFNAIHQTAPLAGNIGLSWPRYGRAEGRNPTILAVQGVLLLQPSTWTLGSIFVIGIRFGKFEQDVTTRSLLVDNTYTLWAAPTDMTARPARWANDRSWDREHRDQNQFATGNETVSWKYRFNFRTKRTLKPNECYAMYVETLAGSVTLNARYMFRTLVSDPNA